MLVVALLGAATVAEAEPVRFELTPIVGVPVGTLADYANVGYGALTGLSKAPLRNSPELHIGLIVGYIQFPRSQGYLPSTELLLGGGTLRLEIASGPKHQTYVRLDGGLARIGYQTKGNRSSDETGLFASPIIGVQIEAGKRLGWVFEFRLLGVTGDETRELRAVTLAAGIRW